MFKRPRSNKEDREATPTSQYTNKRLKEDRPGRIPQQEDYVNVTFPCRSGEESNAPGPCYQTVMSQLAQVVESQEKQRYNRLKLQHIPQSRSEGDIRRICSTPWDSDTSSVSSDVTETHSKVDSREKEHYNKLKVNVNHIKTNKKLMKGVKILQTQSNDAIPSGSTRKSAQGSVRVARVHRLSTDTYQPMIHKYKKEGHTNRLHSIRSLPNCTPQAILLPKSKSTGDISKMNQIRVTRAYPSTHQLAHSKSCRDMTSCASCRDIPYHDTDYMEPMDISHNMESSHDTESSQDMESSRDTESRQSVVSMESVAPINRKRARDSATPLSDLSTSLPSCINSSCINELYFINKMITFVCTHEGKEITSTAYDFSVKVHKGTIRKKKSMEFHLGVCLHGPFIFPKGYKLASPILMVTSPTNGKLKKPMEVVLSHCIHLLQTTKRDQNITFFRANKTRNGATESYRFEPTDSASNSFESHTYRGKLSSLELGFFCIMTKQTTARKQTNYCLVPIVPRNVESSSWIIHYCVTLNLQAFIKVGKGSYASFIKFGSTSIFTHEEHISMCT